MPNLLRWDTPHKSVYYSIKADVILVYVVIYFKRRWSGNRAAFKNGNRFNWYIVRICFCLFNFENDILTADNLLKRTSFYYFSL